MTWNVVVSCEEEKIGAEGLFTRSKDRQEKNVRLLLYPSSKQQHYSELPIVYF